MVTAQELVNITAIGSIDYEWNVSIEEKQTALDQAKLSAWKKYTSKFNAGQVNCAAITTPTNIPIIPQNIVAIVNCFTIISL